MRLLWIEDFGGHASSDSLVAGFIHFISDDLAWDLGQDIHDLSSSGVRGGRAYWDRFYRSRSTWEPREIDVITRYDDMKELVDERGATDLYDVALIDIDLSEHGFFAQEVPGIDPARAGIWIYNQLVRRGFPAERMAFLTGNGDKAKEYEAVCARHYLLPPPVCFIKGSPPKRMGDHPVALAQWLQELEAADGGYLTLRRGVLDGCIAIDDLLASPEALSHLRFNQFLSAETPITADEMRDYARSLMVILPIDAPDGGRPARTYRLFVRALAHDWENEAKPNRVNRNFAGGEAEANVLRILGHIMKRTRNWLSHGRKLDSIGGRDVAFLFLVNLRAMFDLGGEELEPFERKLLQLTEAAATKDRESAVCEALERRLRTIRSEVAALWNEWKTTARPDELKKIEGKEPREYGAMITRLDEFNGLPDAFDCVRALYLMLWLGLWHEEPSAVWERLQTCPKWLQSVLMGTAGVVLGGWVVDGSSEARESMSM